MAYNRLAPVGGGGGDLLPTNNTWTGTNVYNNAVHFQDGVTTNSEAFADIDIPNLEKVIEIASGGYIPKSPVRIFASVDLPLSGLAAILNSEGISVTPVAGDSICASAQSDALQNARYKAAAGVWELMNDCQIGSDQTHTIFTETSTGAKFQQVNSPAIVGTDVLSFVLSSPATVYNGDSSTIDVNNTTKIISLLDNAVTNATVSGSAAIVVTKIGLLTGFVSGAGTVSATDTLLQALQKLNGNIALKAPINTPTFTNYISMNNPDFALDWDGVLKFHGIPEGLAGVTFSFTAVTSVTVPTAGVLLSSTTLSGTSNQINKSIDGDGSVTLSTPQDIATTSSPTFSYVYVDNSYYFRNSGNTLSLNVATLTGTRFVNFPNANSCTVQPTSVVANQFVTAISAQGVLSLAQPTFSNLSGTCTAAQGGTGVNNGSSTITLGGNFTTSGSFTTTLTVTGNTNVTLPTSGTLATVAATVAGIIGTTNQVLVNGTAGATVFSAATLTLPQSIATSSNVQFAKLGIGVAPSAYNLEAVLASTAGESGAFLRNSSSNGLKFTIDNTGPVSGIYSTNSVDGVRAMHLNYSIYSEYQNVALCTAVGAFPSFGGGTKVIFEATVSSTPTSNPSGGAFRWFDGTNYKYRDAAGNIKTITAV